MTLPALNFSGRDFTTEFERLLVLLRQQLPEYTDLNHSDMGVLLIGLLSRHVDQEHSYIDRIAAETFVNYAKFKKSLISLGTLVGYVPVSASPASTRLLLTRINGITGAIEIPKYSEFTRSDSLAYLTVEDTSIAAGVDSVEVDAIQGVVIERTFTASDWVTNDWTGRTKIALTTNVVNSTVEVWSGEAPTYWTYTDSFWRASETDYLFSLELDGDTDTTYLCFSDGTQGVVVPDPVYVRCVKTDAAEGNGGSATVTSITEVALYEKITCTNTEICSGGAATETAESIRQNIPSVTRTQRRAVTNEDYLARVSIIPGVLHCAVVDRNDSPVWPHNYIALYVVPAGGGTMTTYLRNLILDDLTMWGHLGSWEGRYLLFDATEQAVNVSVRIGVLAGHNTTTVSNAVIAAVNTFFDPANQEIGQDVTYSALHTAIDAVTGVSWSDITTPAEDVSVANGYLPVAGSVSVVISS
jgi:uncharacterized phage protein gp47/JayE